MAVDWQPLALAPRARFEKQFGSVAELLRRRAPDEPSLAPTWLLERKALRRALELAVPPDHLPADLAAETNPLLMRQKAARAYCRLRDAKALVPELPKLLTDRGDGRFLVWSSPAQKPRRLELPELCRVLEVDAHGLRDAVAELWATVFFEAVLRATGQKAARIEVAIGVTRASAAARVALGELLAKVRGAKVELLPLPGRAVSVLPSVELDRSLAERSTRTTLTALAGVTKLPRGLFAVSGGRWGVDASAFDGAALAHTQRAALGEYLGAPGEGAPSSGPELRRLGSWVETLLEDRATERQLEREIEGEERELASRFTWMREMDLAILPADGLRRTIEELLEPTDRATGLAVRATHAAALAARLHGALGSFEAGTIEAGLNLPPLAFLRALTFARQLIDDGESSVEVAFDLSWDYPEYFPGALGRDPFALPESAPSEALQLLRSELRFDVDELRESARVHCDQAIARAEARAPRFVAALTAPLRSRARRMVELRERARALEVRLDYLLRRVLLDAGRRLPRFDLDLDEGSVWHARVSEIIEAVDLRGHSLKDRVRWRRAELARHHAECSPLAAMRQDPAPTALATARRLDALPWMLAEHRPTVALSGSESGPVGAAEEVRYEGRPSDTAPSVLRALGLSVNCSVRPS